MTIDTDNHHFSSDGTHCYARGKRIAQADAASFQRVEVSPYLAYDCRNVYAISDAREGLIVVPGLDTAALYWADDYVFSTLHDVYAYNYHFVEHANDRKYASDARVVKAIAFRHRAFSPLRDLLLARYPDTVGWWHPDYPWHAVALRACGDAERSGYYSYGDSSFYLEEMNSGEMLAHYLPLLQSGARQDLNAFYAKSATQVYYQYRAIDADAASFVVLGGKFAKDAHRAYFNGYPVEGADAASFEMLPYPDAPTRATRFARCKHQAYVTKTQRIGKFQGYANVLVPIKGADPASFQPVNHAWAKDKNHVYEDGIPKAQRCAADFHVIAINGSDIWATDSRGLYNANGRRVVKGAESGKFVALNSFWFSNGTLVFSALTERLMPSIDAASFEVLDDQGTARDAQFEYYVYHQPGWEAARGDIRKRKRKPGG